MDESDDFPDARQLSSPAGTGDGHLSSHTLAYSPSPTTLHGKQSPRVSEFYYSNSPTPSQWPEDSRPRMWNPFWLRKSILFAFAACFLCMLLVTALLYHFSVKNHGLSTQREANHYGWKYGPTAGEFASKVAAPFAADKVKSWSLFRPYGGRSTTPTRS